MNTQEIGTQQCLRPPSPAAKMMLVLELGKVVISRLSPTRPTPDLTRKCVTIHCVKCVRTKYARRSLTVLNPSLSVFWFPLCRGSSTKIRFSAPSDRSRMDRRIMLHIHPRVIGIKAGGGSSNSSSSSNRGPEKDFIALRSKEEEEEGKTGSRSLATICIERTEMRTYAFGI